MVNTNLISGISVSFCTETKFKYEFIYKTLHPQPKRVKKRKLSGSFNFIDQL